ncbi:hypothetical protein [Qipengyuania sp. MTN3-11]
MIAPRPIPPVGIVVAKILAVSSILVVALGPDQGMSAIAIVIRFA